MSRTFLIGQAPSRTSDPSRPLSGLSGARLAELAGVERLDDVFEVRNVLRRFPGRSGGSDSFPLAEARSAGEFIRAEIRGRRAILLGRKVALALGFPGLVPLVWFEDSDFVRGEDATEVAYLPHPSGLNRFWNDPTRTEAARRFLRKEIS